MNRRIIVEILVIALGALLTYTAPAVGQTAPKDSTQKTGDASERIKGYTVEKKNEAVAYGKKLVSDLDKKIKDLEAQIARDTSSAKADLQRQLSELKAKRAQAGRSSTSSGKRSETRRSSPSSGHASFMGRPRRAMNSGKAASALAPRITFVV